MYRAIVLLVGLLLTLGACTTQRMICPAYQSAFIHDPVALSKRVSYFENDSTPKILTVSKSKYLIIPEQSYRKKIRSMQTVPMKSIKAVVPDSLQTKKGDSTNAVVGAEQDSTATHPPDSLKKAATVDSTYMISIDKEVRVLKYRMDSMKYYIDNVLYTADQDNYMWYFRDVLVLPDVRAALEDKANANAGKGTAGGAEGVGGQKEKGGFFKNLFKKKDKQDTTAASTTSKDSEAEPAKQKKKGLFGRKKETVNPTPPKPTDPAKKEDDGF